MSDYPLPSYAASVWVVGDQVHAGFDGHTVAFPNTETGLTLLLAVLRERARDNAFNKIGTKSSPTKYAVERALVNDKRYNELLRAMHAAKAVSDTERQESIAWLKELGL